MNINSHIRKIIVLAFFVLSLSFIFPAVSYAATDAPPSCNNRNQINEEYILTNVGSGNNVVDVLLKYKPGAVFSGVYNVETKEWMALPSYKTYLKEEEKSGFCTVEPRGGHEVVAERFGKKIDKETDEKKNVGFAIVTEPPILKLRFISGKLNCPYTNKESRKLPGNEQDQIELAIKEAVGKDYKVQKDDKYVTDEKCPQKPGS
ncbi:hypothetical protein QUB05_30685 [Microcoleus sp. F10-C6]|uniref:hypothetical protein n=1 Tax=unclassified Microcoleus TaxID=2642155 RepID=UPI002FD33386